MDDDRWRALNRRAVANHGIIGPADLDWAEIPASTFSRFAKQHGCRQRHRGCWTLPAANWTFECQVACALAVVRAPAYVTGEAGLHLLGVEHRRPSTVDLLVAASRSGRGRRQVAVRRTTRMDRIRTVSAKGFTVACVEQCLVDASRLQARSLLTKCMAAACRLRLTDLDSIDEYGQHLGAFPGSVNYRAAISSLRGELVHSEAEQVARDALRSHDLGFHHEPYTVWQDGIPIAEIDIAKPDILYGVEIDGPHHDLPEQRRRDEERDQGLREVGWRIDRFGWEDVLADPAGFAARIRATVEKRRHASRAE